MVDHQPLEEMEEEKEESKQGRFLMRHFFECEAVEDDEEVELGEDEEEEDGLDAFFREITALPKRALKKKPSYLEDEPSLGQRDDLSIVAFVSDHE